MDFGERFERLATMAELLGEEATAERLRAAADGLRDRAFRIVVFGEFNRGKSTLINSLLGRVVLPARLVPTTGHVTEVVYGSPAEIVVSFADGRSERCPPERLDEFASLRDGLAREDVREVRVLVPHGLLEAGLILIDTPGVSDAAAQTARAEAALEGADLVLFVLDATRLLGEAERDMILTWMVGTWGKPVVPVLNRLNLVDEAERPDVLGRLDLWQARNLPPVLSRGRYAVNAVAALRRALGTAKAADAEPDDFPALAADLAALVGPAGAEFARRSRQARLRRVLLQLHESNRRGLAELSQGRRSLDEERRGRTAAVRDRRSRWTVRLLECRHVVAEARPRAEREAWDIFAEKIKAAETAELRNSAGRWYRRAEEQAVERIEAITARAFAEAIDALTADGEPAPRHPPFTLRERLSLEARFETAGTLGSEVRRWMGDAVVDWFEQWWGPPPQQRVLEQARPPWEAFVARLRERTDDQWNERRQEIERQLLREEQRLLRLAESAQGELERTRREKLDACLAAALAEIRI